MKISTFAVPRLREGTLTGMIMVEALKFKFKCKFLRSFSGTTFTAEVWLSHDTMAPFQGGYGGKVKQIWLPTAIP
jgi:hypothetical protein